MYFCTRFDYQQKAIQMEELITKLTNPFAGIRKDDKDGIRSICSEIAISLFNDYCIQCDDTECYFAEIEFYYYDEEYLNDKWNEVTYPRMGYRAGSIFYHLSGMDICFESNLEKRNGVLYGKGGGILIRSIVDEKNNLIVGPLTCVNVMLNNCKDRKMPQLKRLSTSRNITPMPTYRFLGKHDFENIGSGNRDGELKLAYYDKTTISPELWNKARSSYYSKRLDCPVKHE